MAATFQFDLVSPERLLISGPAAQVVVPGSEGQFTVLPGHAPIMSTLRPGVLEITLDGGRNERVFVRGGFADVNAAGLTVLAEQAIPLAELSSEMIAGQIRNAEEDVADAKDETRRAAARQKVDQLKEVQTALTRGAGH